MDSRYDVRMPELPPAWETTLGSPRWQVEWLDGEGRKQTATVRGSGAVISLPATWVSAVSAAPFWPDRGLGPGIFKPAGAIFPYDVSGKSLILSWQGGVDAHLYGEFAAACGEAGQEANRLPWNFNWPRFRRLFDDPTLNEEIRADPWLADWSAIAAKIIQSGFDKRRLVPEARSEREIPVSPGPWIGVSPFSAPLLFDDVPVFPVREKPDTWVSAEGVLRCNTETWILLP
ncbi:MAG: hypothetical protein FWF55_06885 [Treponema sp.]|nr:hypothetical protein [Treponema sp.]